MPESPASAEPLVLYFAYGSNLDLDQMKSRCPSAEPAGIAQLLAHKLAFTRKSQSRQCGVADVVPEDGQNVWGVLYHITQGDLARLDRSEGYRGPGKSNSYERKAIMVNCGCCGTKQMSAHTYIAVREENPPPPNEKYLRLIIDGARHWKLPEAYIKELEKRAGIVSLIGPADVAPLVRQILTAVTAATAQVGKMASECGGLDSFMRLRFEKAFEGLPGICGKTNFQEVLNQASTSLVALAGCEYLFRTFPEVKYLALAWQEGSGLDIESSKHSIAAECYAATTRHSNDKFESDLAKLQRRPEYSHRYLFYYSHAQEKDSPSRPSITIIGVPLPEFVRKHLAT